MQDTLGLDQLFGGGEEIEAVRDIQLLILIKGDFKREELELLELFTHLTQDDLVSSIPPCGDRGWTFYGKSDALINVMRHVSRLSTCLELATHRFNSIRLPSHFERRICTTLRDLLKEELKHAADLAEWKASKDRVVQKEALVKALQDPSVNEIIAPFLVFHKIDDIVEGVKKFDDRSSASWVPDFSLIFEILCKISYTKSHFIDTARKLENHIQLSDFVIEALTEKIKSLHLLNL